MTTVANASVVFKDKNGNVGTVKGASANDVTKIRTAISDVAQVVDPTSHLPINATTSSVGVVQLADSAAVAAGTSGRVVDAAQLKDAIEHVTPAGNLMTTDTAQTVTAVKTFSSLPESSVVPTTNNQLVNKKYVDDHATPLPSNLVTTDTAQTISAVKTFTALPQSSVAPSASSDLVNKAYVDGQVAVDSTYTEPSVSKGILSPATNRLTPPSTAQELAIPQSHFPGEIIISTVPITDANVHLADGALLDGAGSYAEFVEIMASLVSIRPDLFVTELAWQTAVATYGVCGKYVYDSVNNTLRIPKVNAKIYTGGGTTPVAGNGINLGLTNGTLYRGLGGRNDYGSLTLMASAYGAPVGTGYSGANLDSPFVYGVTPDASKSGIVANIDDTTTLVDVYYYIVIGTVSKLAIQVDIDQIATDLNGKADTDLTNTVPTNTFSIALNNANIRTVVETYVNGASWYRVWSDGWCEQGSTINSTGINNSNYEVVLLKPFVNTNYFATQNRNISNNTAANYTWINVWGKTTTSFRTAVADFNVDWFACGYIS